MRPSARLRTHRITTSSGPEVILISVRAIMIGNSGAKARFCLAGLLDGALCSMR